MYPTTKHRSCSFQLNPVYVHVKILVTIIFIFSVNISNSGGGGGGVWLDTQSIPLGSAPVSLASQMSVGWLLV